MPADKSAVEADLNALKESGRSKSAAGEHDRCSGRRYEGSKRKTDEQLHRKLFAKVYEQAQAAAGAGQASQDRIWVQTQASRCRQCR